MNKFNEKREHEEVEVFGFAELPEQVQNRIVEQNQYVLVEDPDWFEVVKDDFTETLELLGFYDVVSYFSGFGCQGDGASFTGSWDSQNMVTDVKKWQSDEYQYFKPLIDKLLNLGGTAEVERISSRYVHEFTCFTCADNPELEGTLEQLRLDCSKMYYRNLEGEYDHLTSDEVIRDYFLSCFWLKYTRWGVCVNG